MQKSIEYTQMAQMLHHINGKIHISDHLVAS